jgi:hypothetical protein
MSTQFYTDDRQDTSQQGTGRQAPRHQGDGPSWFRIFGVVIGTVVAAALIVVAAVSLTHSHSSPAPASGGTSTSTAVPVQPTTPVSPVHPGRWLRLPGQRRTRDAAPLAAAELAEVGTGTGSGLHNRSGRSPPKRAGSCPSAR